MLAGARNALVDAMPLPDRIGTSSRPVSLVCPDWGDALAVRAEADAEYLAFVCHVGHSSSATTLLSGQEERLEEVLWSGVYLVEELADLLADLDTRGDLDDGNPARLAARRRIERVAERA
jgi:hypothetical protein